MIGAHTQEKAEKTKMKKDGNLPEKELEYD